MIVSTPVYNAGPSGLFTSFFQAIEDDLLIAKPVLLAATAASPRHALVVDDQMRPMFAYLRAPTVPTSLFAAAEDWNDPELGSRIQRAVTELVLLMDSDFFRQVRDTSWDRYRHDFGNAGASRDGIDFDSDMMKLAAGGSSSRQDRARKSTTTSRSLAGPESRYRSGIHHGFGQGPLRRFRPDGDTAIGYVQVPSSGSPAPSQSVRPPE